jgi:RNA polymerase sigma factor (sigma-70 family)
LNQIESWTDEELMRRVREGEVSLLSALFNRHYRPLFRYCWRMTGETQLSEDLVQEVFLKILRHRESFRSESSFTTWMYAIARNTHLDAWAKRKRETPLEHDTRLAAEPVSDSLERRQEAALLNQVLLRLPEDQREVIVMSRFLEMTHAEIGLVMGCGAGTSRTRLCRALSSLREMYMEAVRRRIS